MSDGGEHTVPAERARPCASMRLGDPGFVADRLETYLSDATGRPARVRGLSRFSFGFSWITYGFVLDDQSGASLDLVLRLGPPTGLFAPYTVAPQALSVRSLAGSGVPVPDVRWSSDDPGAFGAPFLIADRAAGSTVDPWSIAVTSGDPQRLAEEFVDILARLHVHEWRGTPIEGLAPAASPMDVAVAQLDLWRGRIEAAQLRPYALLTAADLWFRRNVPVPARLSIVHGDYRVGNFLEEGGSISAVLDWELTHVGDPVEDLGWALLPMYNGGRKALLGEMPVGEVLARYESRTGLAVDARHLAFYAAFALYKSAAIQVLAARRFEDGGFGDMRLAGMGAQLPGLLRQIDRAMEKASA